MTGTYSGITIYGAPNSARPGTIIEINIRIDSEGVGIGFYASPWLTFDGDEQAGDVYWVTAGGYHLWGPFYFAMPDHDVTLRAESWCFIDYEWIMDDATWTQIKAEEAPPEFTLDVVVEPAGAGYVTKDPDLPKYPAGTYVVLRAYPYEDYEFEEWIWDSVYGGSAPSIGIYIGADIVARAIFAGVIPEYNGTISRKELKYDTITEPIPVR